MAVASQAPYGAPTGTNRYTAQFTGGQTAPSGNITPATPTQVSGTNPAPRPPATPQVSGTGLEPAHPPAAPNPSPSSFTPPGPPAFAPATPPSSPPPPPAELSAPPPLAPPPAIPTTQLANISAPPPNTIATAPDPNAGGARQAITPEQQRIFEQAYATGGPEAYLQAINQTY